MTTNLTRQLETLLALATEHFKEEQAEAKLSLLDSPRPQKVVLPHAGKLPRSSHFLARLYSGGRMAKEKKPGLFDHLRSFGPWMVSIDDEPLSVLDGMSQTATLTHGFAVDEVVRSYMRGAFGQSSCMALDTAVSSEVPVETYAKMLANLVPHLNFVSFTNSGAEANEKAFALCRPESAYPNATKVMGFRGSFHGRTLLALQTTWNPVKRAPFELPSYRSVFAEFPLMDPTASEDEEVPTGFYQALSTDPTAESLRSFSQQHTKLFDQEIESLCQVLAAANSGEVFCVIVEPMQSEGGDRYATARFYRCLRMLTRSVGLPLIFDEVQTGYGLGGPFDWSSKYGLIKPDGSEDAPDAITYAKRAQVGVCISRFADPEPTSAHIASIIRATLTTSLMDFGPSAEAMEALVKPKLKRLAERYRDLVKAPRCTGFAFAFDLPSPSHLMTYLGQRFWRGAVVFGAGTKTVRYRLSHAFLPEHVELLFTTIHDSLAYLDEHGDVKAPNWVDAPLAKPIERGTVRIRVVEPEERAEVLEHIMQIESEVYEKARQDSKETLSIAFQSDGGVAVIAEMETSEGWRIIGSALAGPIESFPSLDGPKQDETRGNHDTAYSMALTLLPECQGLGVGRRLKQAQLRAVRDCKRPDGSNRYESIVGRNRIGRTASMGHLNDSFGAYTERILEHQYGDEDGKARYYRIPLNGFVPKQQQLSDDRLHWSAGISLPFATPPASLKARESAGTLFGPTVNKVTICNYVTPSVVRAVEWVNAIAPEYPHLYLTSGRDELIDKSVRLLRYQRANAEICISFQGTYVGHTSATSRSVSCASTHAQGEAIFDWPQVPHPATDVEACVKALDQMLYQRGGSEKILGLFVEPLGERSGLALTESHAQRLNEWSAQNQVPVVSIETASYCRGFETIFGYQSIGLNAGLMAWWAGGQTGFLHVKPPFFIEKPLMMVSTWDGDELSMIRVHHQSVELTTGGRNHWMNQLNELYSELSSQGCKLFGQGAYRLIDGGEGAQAFVDACTSEGLILRCFANNLIPLVIQYDTSRSSLERGVNIIRKHQHYLNRG